MTPAEAMVEGLERAGFRCVRHTGDMHHPRLIARSAWASWVCERSGLRIVLIADTRGTPVDVLSVHDAEVK